MFGDRIRELIGTWSPGTSSLRNWIKMANISLVILHPRQWTHQVRGPTARCRGPQLAGAIGRCYGARSRLTGFLMIFVGSCHDYFAHDTFPGGLRLSISICWVPFWIFSPPWKAMSLLKLLIYIYNYIYMIYNYIYDIYIYIIFIFDIQFLEEFKQEPILGRTWRDLRCQPKLVAASDWSHLKGFVLCFFFRSFSCVSWEFWADPKYASLYVNLWQVGVKKIPLPGRKDWLSKLVLATSVILTLWSRTELNKTLMTWVWVKIKELGDYNLHLQWIFPLKSPFLVDFPSKT